MAEKLQEIAKFSEDAITMALNTMPEEQWKNFKSGLNVLAENMGEKKKKNQLKTQKLSDEVVFKNYVLPAIYHRMQEIEQQEMRGILNVNVNFAVITSYAAFNLEQMLSEDSKLVMAEDGLKVLALQEIIAQGQKVKIERVKMKTPGVKFSTDPDWMRHDLHSKAGMSDRDLQAMVASCVTEDEEADLQKAMTLSKINID